MRRTSPTGSTPVVIRRRSGGFTLLELLVAVVLGSIISAAVYQTFTTAVDSSQRIARSAESSQAWRFLVERFRADVSRLSTAEQSFQGRSDSLLMVLDEAAGTARAVYEVNARRDERTVRRRLDDQAATVVYESDATVQFSYLTNSGWVDIADAIPRAVRLNVKAAGGERRFAVAVEFEVEADEG